MRYEASKGLRVKRYGWGVTTRPEVEVGWWFYYTTSDVNGPGKWYGPDDELPPNKYGFSSHASCKNVRAFRRMLRKNPQLRGKLVFVSRYLGHCVYG
jgi:hypothetical protein